LGIANSCGGGPTQPDLSVPTLLTPANGAILDNGCFDFSEPQIWDFDWSDTPGATAYHLHVMRSGSQTPVIDLPGLTRSSDQRATNSFVGEPFLNGWQWRVRAEIQGTYRDWSATRSFSVEPPDTDCR
jgi:hypothetical protein